MSGKRFESVLELKKKQFSSQNFTLKSILSFFSILVFGIFREHVFENSEFCVTLKNDVFYHGLRRRQNFEIFESRKNIFSKT